MMVYATELHSPELHNHHTPADNNFMRKSFVQHQHPTVFLNSYTVTLLFNKLSTDAGVPFWCICVICFLGGILAVVLKYLRNKMEMLLFQFSTTVRNYERTPLRQYMKYALANISRALAVFVVLTWDYLLMLSVMTFNTGIFFSVVGGVGCGFLIMGHLFNIPDTPIESIVKMPLCYSEQTSVPCSFKSDKLHQSLPNQRHIQPLTKNHNPLSTKKHFIHVSGDIFENGVCCCSI